MELTTSGKTWGLLIDGKNQDRLYEITRTENITILKGRRNKKNHGVKADGAIYARSIEYK